MNNLHLDIRWDSKKSIESLYLSVLKIDYFPLAFPEMQYFGKNLNWGEWEVMQMNFNIAVQNYILCQVIVEQF